MAWRGPLGLRSAGNVDPGPGPLIGEPAGGGRRHIRKVVMRMPFLRSLVARLLFTSIVALLAAAACSGQKDIEAVAVGQDVALVKTDGALVEGTVARVDDTDLQVASGPTNRSIPKEQIAELKVVDRAKPAPPPPPAAKFREYTVPVGTPLAVRLTTALSSRTARVEDRVEATLIEPVSIGGAEVMPAGSRIAGTVNSAVDSG